MKTGNVGQAAVLSMVAVGAIGFLVFRLLPPSHAKGKANAQSASNASGAPDVASQLPTEVFRDAFAHPALQRRMRDANAPVALTGQLVAATASGPIGTDPRTEATAEYTAGSKQNLSTRSAQPGESKGKYRPIKGTATPISLQLKAVMRATSPMALVALDGKKEQMMGQGDALGNGFVIRRITEDAVVLARGKQNHVVLVGHTEVLK